MKSRRDAAGLFNGSSTLTRILLLYHNQELQRLSQVPPRRARRGRPYAAGPVRQPAPAVPDCGHSCPQRNRGLDRCSFVHYLMAASAVALCPLLMIFFVTQRYITKNLLLTGSKS